MPCVRVLRFWPALSVRACVRACLRACLVCSLVLALRAVLSCVRAVCKVVPLLTFGPFPSAPAPAPAFGRTSAPRSSSMDSFVRAMSHRAILSADEVGELCRKAQIPFVAKLQRGTRRVASVPWPARPPAPSLPPAPPHLLCCLRAFRCFVFSRLLASVWLLSATLAPPPPFHSFTTFFFLSPGVPCVRVRVQA